MKKYILFCASLLLLAGCKTTKYVPVIETHTDTLYISKQQRDSIWLHDSIYVKEYTQGDTVFVLHDRWHTKYIEREVHDTIQHTRIDSVPQPYPVEVQVAKPLSWWQKTRMRLGEVFLFALGVCAVIVVLKIKRYFMP